MSRTRREVKLPNGDILDFLVTQDGSEESLSIIMSFGKTIPKKPPKDDHNAHGKVNKKELLTLLALVSESPMRYASESDLVRIFEYTTREDMDELLEKLDVALRTLGTLNRHLTGITNNKKPTPNFVKVIVDGRPR